MLKNYFKIAIAILKRRKFFTFVSLFGISFTLATLLVLTAFIEKIVNDDYPDRKRARSLYLTGIEENGPQAMSSSAFSLDYIQRYLKTMKTPVDVAFYSARAGTNTYHAGKKIGISLRYVNASYWDVLEFEFLEGKPFDVQQVRNREKVTVITEDLRRQYFGEDVQVVGKFIEADNQQFRVSGVVKNVPGTTYFFNADMYVPYSVTGVTIETPPTYHDEYSTAMFKGKVQSYQGEYSAVLLAADAGSVAAMQTEYKNVVARLKPSDKMFDKVLSYADYYPDAYLRTGNMSKPLKRWVYSVIGGFVFLLIFLPSVNLVNINLTRIMERSSEIAVRKAFGASSNTLVYQFIVENIILTLLGGIAGILLAMVMLYIFNDAAILPHVTLHLNPVVLVIGLITCLVFGLVSGVYPAWRMSRLAIVKALKA
ncbi:putative ABC transport system permease protein [Chitinophaga jiangningensis]|uniref:Putative ABC transport system permease protein n=1 Tax=Chitinophaga jiangningensis TaxID=1419482 RepID=A0A1M7LUA0_9BACT|nr:ABC transporter permease [Chitinophaga jiangningensis]SHM81795.1 putative ABC transport system permease protein [Chitinophaga jiangningensis]